MNIRRLLPKKSFKISIHELLREYQAQEVICFEFRRTHLCYFIHKELFLKSIANRIWYSLFPVIFSFRDEWIKKVGATDPHTHVIEGWIIGHPDFKEANEYWNTSNAQAEYSLSRFRLLCLQRAAELYPDWVLEFKF
jgi:hypothetical protein